MFDKSVVLHFHARPTINNAVDLFQGIEDSAGGAGELVLHNADGGLLGRLKMITDPVITPVTALHLARRQLKQAVIDQHGAVGWRILKNRVPELRQGAAQVSTAHLASKIKTVASGLDISARVSDLLKKDMFDAKIRVQHLRDRLREKPIFIGKAIGQAQLDAKLEREACTFADYEAAQERHVADLALEFSPPGVAWDVAAELAGLTQPPTADEATALSLMIGASIRQYVRVHGTLPSRAVILDIAVKHANTFAGQGIAKSDHFADLKALAEDADHRLLGRLDFPTPELQAEVEALALQIRKGTARDKYGDPLMDNGKEPVLLQAMRQVHGNKGNMVLGYTQVLKQQMDAIDAAPAPQGPTAEHTPAMMREAAKLGLLMPGSRFFDYLKMSVTQGKLGPEALNGYKRVMVAKLREPGAQDSLAFDAWQAYVEAIEFEKAKHVRRDPATVKAIASLFNPECADLLRHEGTVETVVVATAEDVRDFEGFLRGKNATNQATHGNGFSDGFMSDVYRNRIRLQHADTAVEVVEGLTQAAAFERYRAYFEGDEAAAKTLSYHLHQNAIGLLAAEWEISCCSADEPRIDPNSSKVVVLVDQGPIPRGFDQEWELKKLPEGKVQVQYRFLRGADTLMLGGTKTLPINRTNRFDGPVNESNAAVQQLFRVVYDLKDLRAGVLRPHILGKPVTEVRIRPDWGQIELLRKKG